MGHMGCYDSIPKAILYLLMGDYMSLGFRGRASLQSSSDRGLLLGFPAGMGEPGWGFGGSRV